MKKNNRKLHGYQTTNTTYHLWQNYRPFLKQHFWKENTFWTDGYFVCSVGEASPETIRKYIQNQG